MPIGDDFMFPWEKEESVLKAVSVSRKTVSGVKDEIHVDSVPSLVGPIGPWMPQRVELLAITPSQARVILDDFNPRNRRFRIEVSERVRVALKTGKWKVNGETIIFGFDTNTGRGILLDGQNRLRGCVNANKTMNTYVSFGFDPEMFTTIDRGSSRGLADDLSIKKHTNCLQLAAASRIAIAYRSGIRTSSVLQHNPSSEEVFEFLEENPEIIESVSYSMNHSKSIATAGRLIGACHFLFGVKSSDSRDEYFEELASGAELKADSPVLAARKRLIQNKLDASRHVKSTHFSANFLSLCVLIVSWNAFRKGMSLTKIVVRASGSFKDEKSLVLPEID